MPYDPMRHAADPDAASLPRFTADCYDDCLTVEMHVSWACDALSDTLAALASKQDCMIWDAAGFGPSHAAAWDALSRQASDVAAAVLALQKAVKAA